MEDEDHLAGVMFNVMAMMYQGLQKLEDDDLPHYLKEKQKMRPFKIYLAGKMSGLTFEEMNGWRAELHGCSMRF